MTGLIRKSLAFLLIIVILQAHFHMSSEEIYLNRHQNIAYGFGQPSYYSEEFGPITFKSSSEGGSYFWDDIEKEFYTENGGYITIRYIMFLGIYFDLTDEELNRETSNMEPIYEDEL